MEAKLDNQSNNDQKVAAADKQSSSEQQVSFMTWRDLPLIIFGIPLMILLGFHVAGLAILIRKYLRIPYIINLVGLYLLLLLPLWLFDLGNIWFRIIGSVIVLYASIHEIIHRIDRSKDPQVKDINFEDSVPAHITLILLYLTAPAIEAIGKANDIQDKKNMQNKVLETNSAK